MTKVFIRKDRYEEGFPWVVRIGGPCYDSFGQDIYASTTDFYDAIDCAQEIRDAYGY